jgi:3-hydroxyisobutyrate dehydrogenase-like beta-hydroxyacid dehydrogenase
MKCYIGALSVSANEGFSMKIAFLGAGNIAFALVSGLVEESGPDGLVAADPDPAQGVRFTAIGVDTTDDNRTAADTADIIVISVKPNIVYTVLAEIAPVVRGCCRRPAWPVVRGIARHRRHRPLHAQHAGASADRYDGPLP